MSLKSFFEFLREIANNQLKCLKNLLSLDKNYPKYLKYQIDCWYTYITYHKKGWKW